MQDVFPNPLQIECNGSIAVGVFADADGSGVMFRATDEHHTPGDSAAHVIPNGEHIPRSGEVYVKCHSQASAFVIAGQFIEAAGMLKKEKVSSWTRVKFRVSLWLLNRLVR